MHWLSKNKATSHNNWLFIYASKCLFWPWSNFTLGEHVVVCHLVVCCWLCFISETLEMSSAYEFAKYLYFAKLYHSTLYLNTCNLLQENYSGFTKSCQSSLLKSRAMQKFFKNPWNLVPFPLKLQQVKVIFLAKMVSWFCFVETVVFNSLLKF